jgi:hypothetical protein
MNHLPRTVSVRHLTMDPRSSSARRGNVLLLMLGLITVMVVFAYAFLRSMQMSREVSQPLRQQKLADLAAEMGLQHAIAVSLHEYAMASEVRDDSVLPAVSRIDSPSKNVFNLLSPRLSQQSSQQQPPTPWDLAPDVSFQDLYSQFSGTYHIAPTYNSSSSPTMIMGYSSGWTQHRGYARLFEANRFDYVRSARYDPSTYDDYDLTPLQSNPPAMPNATVVATPFPPVDPFVRGQSIIQRHALDNPLWLDAEYRPISMDDAANSVTNVGAALARYRLRYAICTLDQSPTLWVNTDPSWLSTPAEKEDMRSAYKEALYSVGVQFGWPINHTGGYFTEYGTSLENIMLGQGQYANSRFDGTSGIPLDWSPRGGSPMYYRSPDDGNMTRAIACVHGSPFMTWFDNGSWKGASLTSWNDLSFAIQNYHESWQDRGENGSSSFTNGYTLVRGDAVPQRASTPFGRPYEAVTDHPWQVNVLSVPMRVLEGMVAAYVPPVVRGTQAAEQHIPWVSFPTATVAEETAKPDIKTGFWATAAGTVGTKSWMGPTAWNVANPNSHVPGPGVDLFTDAFRPEGADPFAAYPTPLDRDYWSSSASSRPDHNNPFDDRTNAERYPGRAFFTTGDPEKYAQQSTCWLSIVSDPPQVENDPKAGQSMDAVVDALGAVPGADALGRHIVFYDPASNTAARPKIDAPAAGNTYGYLSSFFSSNPERWATEFSPIQPFTCDRHSASALSNYSANAGEGTQCFVLYPRGTVAVKDINDYTPSDPVPVPDPMNSGYPSKSVFDDQALVSKTQATNRDTLATTPAANPLATAGTAKSGAVRNLAEAYKVVNFAGLNALVAPNSYWNRVSVAFVHSVVVTQIANLAYADPTDARNKDFWPEDGYLNPTNSYDKSNDAAGIIYNPSPNSGHTVTKSMRKGPLTGWNPAAPDFSSMEQVDRQFLANLGESFDAPGTLRTSQVRAATDPTTGVPRPPRYTKCTTSSTSGYVNDQSSPASAASYGYGSYLWVGEYSVTNNIRTLLTPVDGVALTPRSTDIQPPPPRNIWLLDEWKADPAATDVDSMAYTPGSATGDHPTPVARARAKLMERVLNDWRMSFFGSTKAYADDFRPKDFDGDGIVFCSGYLGANIVDTETGLTCWQPVDPATIGDGPGNGAKPGDPGSSSVSSRLTIFSLTGCLAFTRSHQYKILVRGELYDNVIGRPVAEKYLESALLVDPDNNIVRSANPAVLPTGLGDSTVIMQRPIHNYYRGYLSNSYP